MGRGRVNGTSERESKVLSWMVNNTKAHISKACGRLLTLCVEEERRVKYVGLCVCL